MTPWLYPTVEIGIPNKVYWIEATRSTGLVNVGGVVFSFELLLWGGLGRNCCIMDG